MAGPPRCQMVLRTTDLAAAHGLVRAALTDAGYGSLRSRRADGGFEVKGVRGGTGLALLVAWIPFGTLLGYWSRTSVRARCVRSLDEGDERLHLYVRVFPLRELDDDAEEWLITQSAEERLGDSLQARRGLRRVIAAFEERDFTPSPDDALAVPDVAVEPGKPREDVRVRIRRGNRRRNRRLALAAVALLLVLFGPGVYRGCVDPKIALMWQGDEEREAALEVLARAPDWEENRSYYVDLLDRCHEQAFTQARARSRRSSDPLREVYLRGLLLTMSVTADREGRDEIASYLWNLRRAGT